MTSLIYFVGLQCNPVRGKLLRFHSVYSAHRSSTQESRCRCSTACSISRREKNAVHYANTINERINAMWHL